MPGGAGVNRQDAKSAKLAEGAVWRQGSGRRLLDGTRHDTYHSRLVDWRHGAPGASTHILRKKSKLWAGR